MSTVEVWLFFLFILRTEEKEILYYSKCKCWKIDEQEFAVFHIVINKINLSAYIFKHFYIDGFRHCLLQTWISKNILGKTGSILVWQES